MTRTRLKPRKPSMTEITQQYCNNPDACWHFFFDARHPNGWKCPVCGHTRYRMIRGGSAVECCHCSSKDYLFAGTVFQDNKLPLYTLIIGLYEFFVDNTGTSAVNLCNKMGVNIKTAQLFCRKCRYLMSIDEAKEKLTSLFYEADGAFIGAKSKEPGHQGSGTTQQSFMAVLSTGEENKYPHKLKLVPIKTDDSETTEKTLTQVAELGLDKKLNTDGKSTFNVMKKYMQVESVPVDYSDKDHRLYWLNTLIGDVKNQITGIYHGASKRDLPSFLTEQEYRFNNRSVGMKMMDKIASMIAGSHPFTRKMIRDSRDVAMATFIKA